QVGGGGVAADIGGAGSVGARLEHVLDGLDDGRARCRLPEVLEHHRPRPDLYDGVGDRPSINVRRRAVHGLGERGKDPVRVDVAGGRDADGAGGGGAEVGQDVAEEVRGDDHVEALRVEHDLDGQAVDVVLVGLHLGKLLAHGREALVPVRHGD